MNPLSWRNKSNSPTAPVPLKLKMNAYHRSRRVWQGIRSWTISWRRGDFVESCCQCWVPQQPRRLQEVIAPGQEIVWHGTSWTTTSGLGANWTQCLSKELVFSSNFQQVSKSAFFSPANSKNRCFNQPPRGFHSGRPQTIYEQLFCETWYSNHDEYASMRDVVEQFKAEFLQQWVGSFWANIPISAFHFRLSTLVPSATNHHPLMSPKLHTKTV